MPWIESHTVLARHWKTQRATAALGIRTVELIGHLHLLWWWAMDFAPDGDLSNFSAAEIAAAAQWEGDPEAFVDALCRAGGPNREGFLEGSIGALFLHDWDEYGGKLVDRRRADAERKRTTRTRGTASASSATSGGRPAETPDAASGVRRTGEEMTGEDTTGPDTAVAARARETTATATAEEEAKSSPPENPPIVPVPVVFREAHRLLREGGLEMSGEEASRLVGTFPDRDHAAVARYLVAYAADNGLVPLRRTTTERAWRENWGADGPKTGPPTGRAARAPNGAGLDAADAKWAHLVKA